MKLEIGNILRSFIGKNRDADDDTLQHQTEMVEPDDIQTVEQQHIPGFQYNPPVGSRGFVARLGNAWRIMMSVFDLVGRITLNPGEIILYSSSGGNVAASLKFFVNGSALLTVPNGLTVQGNSQFNGTIDATGNISSDSDVIADSLATAISLINHYHIGNLSYQTTVSQMTGGTAKPSGSPSGDASGNIDMQGNDLLDIGGAGTDYSTHGHEQSNDTGGDTESKTDAPS